MSTSTTFTATTSATPTFSIGREISATSASVDINGNADAADDAARDDASERLAAAVYQYITAVRALGRTSINTAEIASALGLPVAAVEGTLAALQRKKVRVAR